jgi:hypothetical protein
MSIGLKRINYNILERKKESMPLPIGHLSRHAQNSRERFFEAGNRWDMPLEIWLLSRHRWRRPDGPREREKDRERFFGEIQQRFRREGRDFLFVSKKNKERRREREGEEGEAKHVGISKKGRKN